jgi:hypothetical protein
MKGQYLAVLIAFIMASVNTTSVIAYSQNETNKTDIGENQSITGTISGLADGQVIGQPVSKNSIPLLYK